MKKMAKMLKDGEDVGQVKNQGTAKMGERPTLPLMASDAADAARHRMKLPRSDLHSWIAAAM